MKQGIAWSEWSIFTRILVTFLGLAVVAMLVIGSVALVNIRALGNYALETSQNVGDSAIRESSDALKSLGEESISQKARDVARQVEMYLAGRPPMTDAEMRADDALRRIAVQPVGETGYTTLFDLDSNVIVIHRFPEQEQGLSALKEPLPAFWDIVESARGGQPSAGYYDWREVDGSIRQKYASIFPVETADGRDLNLWATTYIDEFSRPAEDTRQSIEAAIETSRDYLQANVAALQRFFITIFVLVIAVVALLALLLSRAITRPVTALRQGAREIGGGNLDYQLEVRNHDEIGELAASFNQMAASLKRYTLELEATAAENISKERQIQDNLRRYAREFSQAQENERKRVARELHDDTIQALVVISRQLEALGQGDTGQDAASIRDEVRRVMEGVRRFSQELRPSVLDDLGLVPALQWLASELERESGITVTAQVSGTPRQLSPEAEVTLFRIAQEALNNVRKHAAASRVELTLEFNDGDIRLEIRDDGQGFDASESPAELTARHKLGLVGMQERVQLLGGEIKIQSQPGHGVSLTLTAPL